MALRNARACAHVVAIYFSLLKIQRKQIIKLSFRLKSNSKVFIILLFFCGFETQREREKKICFHWGGK
jgi:hypothetical protein